jgi:hypothetical protein
MLGEQILSEFNRTAEDGIGSVLERARLHQYFGIAVS